MINVQMIDNQHFVLIVHHGGGSIIDMDRISNLHCINHQSWVTITTLCQLLIPKDLCLT